MAAIGLGVVALELSTCLAAEPHIAVDPPAIGVPVVGEHEAVEPSALPRLTQ